MNYERKAIAKYLRIFIVVWGGFSLGYAVHTVLKHIAAGLDMPFHLHVVAVLINAVLGSLLVYRWTSEDETNKNQCPE